MTGYEFSSTRESAGGCDARLRFAALATLAILAGACASGGRAPDASNSAALTPEQALIAYREAVRLDPNSAQAHANLGAALVWHREWEAALAEFQEAARLEPTNAKMWLYVGQAYERLGREAEALQALETGVNAEPRDAGVLNHTAWLYATAKDPTLRDPAKALEYAQRAVEVSQGANANYLDTLAEAYYVNREYDAAIEAEQRALELAPEDPVLQDQLDKFRAAKATEGGG